MIRSVFASRYKIIIFIVICVLFLVLYLLCCFPILNETVSIYSGQVPGDKNSGDTGSDLNRVVMEFDRPIKPGIPDYILINMRVSNTGDIAYPSGSIAVKLGEEIIDDEAVYSIQERSRFYVDGINHNYYIPVGENRYHIYNWDLEQDSLKDSIDNMTIEVPDIEGINIVIEKIEFKKRTFFALDSYVNYFIKNNLDVSQTDRFVTPVYILMVLFFALYAFYIALFYKNIRGKKIYIKTRAIPGKQKEQKSAFSIILPVAIAGVFLLAVFSFYFIGNYFFTSKSYWGSYKKYIVTGSLKETHKGFYDFEEYIFWLDNKLPENNNLIVLVRGEPVYMMAEMAYNLYPRDIKFINTGDMSKEQVIIKIKDINLVNKNSYDFVVALMLEDIIEGEDLIFVDSYSDTGGFLFKLDR